MDPDERQQRTRELARQIWEAEGRPDGQELRHWGMAERLVQAEVAAHAMERGGADATTGESNRADA
ncbi:DUF2934 domain-containing protein [Luteimonas sp. SDU82]|uniref:DUF2934 domain-containing protein n=1 Tax=Luteimonas sp. SDU82 TaxID=3422592 RepID=UPI003EB9A4A2